MTNPFSYTTQGSTGLPFLDTLLNTNQTKQPAGQITRAHVGTLPNPPNSVYDINVPYQIGFFAFTGGSPSSFFGNFLPHSFALNIRKLCFYGIKVVGLSSTPDVLVIRFKSSNSDALKIRQITNLPANPEDGFYVPVPGTTTFYYQPPIPVEVFRQKDAVNVTNVNIEISDLSTGNLVTASAIYIWFMYESINWQ
jgi:hypothetical protein